MSSSYSDGVRIALDITDDALLNGEAIKKIVRYIKSVCGEDVPLSVHLLKTKSREWRSVGEYDPFFEGVVCIDTVEAFAGKINKDRVLSGLDVGVYILSKIKCTHLSLEKLVYFAYAEYLCECHERLFKDRIFAFSHGPVIESVYETYKRSGYKYVEPIKPESDGDLQTKVGEMPARSRILFARRGGKKVRVIDQVVDKYGNLSARELVNLTHREGSPWSGVDSSKPYEVIPDELILERHHVECVS